MSLRFASGKLGARSQGGAAELAARLCRSAQTCCGKLDHEAAVSCGTAARPGLCAPSHGQKVESGNRIPALRGLRCRRTLSLASRHLSLRHTAGAEAVPLSIHACGAQHTGSHGCRRTAMLRKLTCRSCSSGALKARREFCGRPCVLGGAGCPGAIAPGSGIEGRILGLPCCASNKVGRPPGRVPASEYHFTAVPEIST
jgi:hypothetical protein